MHFSDRLITAIETKKSVLCVGLDPRLDRIPAAIREQARAKFPGDVLAAAGEAITVFNRAIIDAVSELVPIVKPQIAFYEQYGLAGLQAFVDTLRYAKSKGLLTIADAKRNDIASTAEAYANAFLGAVTAFDETVPVFDADSVTVTPYLGWDGIKPFLAAARTYEKGFFVLVKTSNVSSGDFQDIDGVNADGQRMPVFETVGHLVESWGADDVGEHGYSCIGAVVGATFPEQGKRLRAIMPQTIFLVPGLGAQGGTVDMVKGCFNPGGLGAIVNSSRDVTFAWEKSDKYGETNFADAARMKVTELNQQLRVVFG